MADKKISELPADGAIGGAEQVLWNDGGTTKRFTIEGVKDYVIDQIEAIAASPTLDSGDSIMILENDTTLKPVTYEVLEDAIAETMYAEADIGAAIADADQFLIKDNATTKRTCTASRLATYMLAELEPDILDISDLAANATPADADLVLTVDGTTPKKTTWSETRDSILGGLDTYMNALAAVVGTNDTDVFYCTQTGTEKKITLLDIVNHIAYPINGAGAAGYLADWSDGDTLQNTYSVGTSFAAGDNTTIPTTKACRDEMDEIINDATAMAAAIVDADTILIDDGAAGTQRKATFTQVKTWLDTTYAYIDGMDQAVDSTATPEFDGLTITDGGNIVLDTTNGTELGTAAGQKLGFWGTAAVVQQAHIADTAAASAVTAQTLTDNSGGGATDDTIGAIDCAITDPADTPATADALRDDLVANAIPDIEGSLQNCADAIAELADEVNKIVADLGNIKTNLDALNTTQDSINALCATIGLTANA